MALRTVLVVLILIFSFILYQNHVGDGRIRLYYPKPNFSIEQVPNLKGRVALITGANVGLGRENALQLAKKGAKVVLACRSSCDPVAKEIQSAGGQAIAMKLDLSDSQSIYSFAAEFRKLNLPIHLFILNAGVMMIPSFTTTKDALEMQIGTNWIGHFYLQHLLQDIVEQSAPSRIVILSSAGHDLFVQNAPPVGVNIHDTPESRAHYSSTQNYGYSKLLNVLHANELAERMRQQNKKVVVVSVHPGAVDTDLGRFIFDYIKPYVGQGGIDVFKKLAQGFTLSVQDGALTQIYAAVSPEIDEKNLSGEYFVPIGRVGQKSKFGRDVTLQKRVWKEAEEIIAKFPRKY